MSTFDRLQKWYLAQCNDEWEHSYGVKIDTLDNPGWHVSIDLKGTALEAAPYQALSIRRTEQDWLDCKVEKHQFDGACGPGNLEETLKVFLDWADAAAPART